MEAVTETPVVQAQPPRLAGMRRVVLKIGSALLVDRDSGGLRQAWLAALMADVAMMRARGQEVLIVSSGSIALGRLALGLPRGPLALEQAQAAAAVGQIRLAGAYEAALVPHGLKAAQVLLTLEDTQSRRRYLNGRATLATLLGLGVVPVVNENDTVATDEIRYGDNDRLAARVALMAGADGLLLLSDIDGLYTGNPRHDPEAAHIPLVTEITPGIEAMAGEAGEDARGGMVTKLVAAKTAMHGGCTMAILHGHGLRPIEALEEGARATWFMPSSNPAAARKQWIAGMKPLGRITVDDGAARALTRGRSLLPAGVTGVTGDFERGDPVEIITADGQVLGAALSGYSAVEAGAIAGRQTGDIAQILGYPGRAAMAHRDDLILWH